MDQPNIYEAYDVAVYQAKVWNTRAAQLEQQINELEKQQAAPEPDEAQGEDDAAPATSAAGQLAEKSNK